MRQPRDTEQTLSALGGLPLWGANRAVDMAIFKFGARYRTADRGRAGEHGDHSLHLQCPWVLDVEGRTVVGSEDPIDRWDREFREVFDPPVSVTAAILARDGKLSIALSGGMSLIVTPSLDGDGDHENSRLFSPGKDHLHLVHRPTGLSRG